MNLTTENQDTFEIFLETSQILLTINQNYVLSDINYSNFITKTKNGEITNQLAREPLGKIIPIFLKLLREYDIKICEHSKYYWKHKSINYLKLVWENPIPDVFEHNEIIDFSDQNKVAQRKNNYGFDYFINN